MMDGEPHCAPADTSRTVPVTYAGGRYDVHIGAGLYRALGDLLRRAFGDDPRSVLIVTNPQVAERYAAAVLSGVAAAGWRGHLCVVPAGERYKTLRTAARIWDACVAHRLERRDLLAALGGGVVGDLTGFAAATYLRGLAYIQLPTTLLAMIDSSVGGKTGVNHRAGKNLIGAFHQPALVVAELETLTTLPRREWNAGWHEAVKYGVIRDADLFARLEARLPLSPRRRLPWDWLAEVVADCCRIKAEIVARDEREAGERKVLNFGHTVGHALEAVTGYRRFRHGEAVGVGMVAACRIAVRLGRLSAAEAARVERLVRRIGHMPGTDGIAVADLMAAMRLDKKVARGRLRFILPSRIGFAEEQTIEAEDVVAEAVAAVLDGFSRRGAAAARW
ncbi:MAG: 3-dehydroquinate synthase [Chloracidobacterium sp.]|nr:3-dehydroquinate synthase [Chloracidobacterium sp.]MDW8216458.1 3-dehydroquinate synthase [Acidobacteriota bacterium]